MAIWLYGLLSGVMEWSGVNNPYTFMTTRALEQLISKLMSAKDMHTQMNWTDMTNLYFYGSM